MRNRWFSISILVLSLQFPMAAMAAEWTGKTAHYIRAGQSGTGTSWADALGALPTTLQRDHVYYLAEGNYGSRTFNDAESGSLYVYIVKATEEDHGEGAGWLPEYGDEPATFTALAFSKGYYRIDGQTGGGPGSWNSGYGIRVRITTNSSAKLVKLDAVSNLQFLHIDFSYDFNDGLPYPAGNPAVATGQDAIYGLNNCSDLYWSHCRFNRAGRTTWLSRGSWSRVLVEYCYIKESTIGGGTDASDQHGEIWSAQMDANGLTDITIRYNNIYRFTSTGGFMFSGANGAYFYGNLFHGASSQANGVISNWSAPKAPSTNVHIYNNTFIECDGQIGWSTASGWVATNNLFYGNSRVNFTGTTHDHSASDVSLGEAHGQTGITSSIFTDFAGGDYTLAQATSHGSPLSAPYDQDALGILRGSDGTWDRGAYEFGGQPGDPAPHITIYSPTSDPTYIATVNSVTLSGTASDNNAVVSVGWTCTTCSPTSGVAIGTTAWSIAAIGINSGGNQIQVTATDSAGQSTSDTITVYYDSGDSSAPIISDVSPTGSVPCQEILNVTCTTDETATCRLDPTKALFDDMTYSMTASGNQHSTILSGLECGIELTFHIRCRDAAGNTTPATAVTFTLLEQDCPQGTADCVGPVADDCETNITSDAEHCGGCNLPCLRNHATTRCEASTCLIDSCEGGYRDCNGLDADGCETETLTSAEHCGDCNTPCVIGTCLRGICEVDCPAPKKACDGKCVDLLSDPSHCGTCTKVCEARKNTLVQCTSGLCSWECAAGWGDCNNNALDGCEKQIGPAGCSSDEQDSGCQVGVTRPGVLTIISLLPLCLGFILFWRRRGHTGSVK